MVVRWVFRARDLMGRSSQLSVGLALVPATFGTAVLAIYLFKFFGLAPEPGLLMVAVIAAIMAFGFWSGRRMGVSMDIFAVSVMLWIAVVVVAMSAILSFV